MIRVSKDHAQNLTLFTVSGEITADEMIVFINDFYTSGPTSLAMWDLLDADGNSFSPADIDRIISAIGKYRDLRKNGKTALVVSSDYAYGMSRMHKAKAEIHKLNVEYFVTRSLDKALEWLGVLK